MIPKKERASSFIVNKVFKVGRRIQSPTIDLVYTKSEDNKFLFAVSVSKKAFINSVDMHKIRRRVYDLIPKNSNIEAQVYVFMVKRPINELSKTTLQECLKQLMGKVR